METVSVKLTATDKYNTWSKEIKFPNFTIEFDNLDSFGRMHTWIFGHGNFAAGASISKQISHDLTKTEFLKWFRNFLIDHYTNYINENLLLNDVAIFSEAFKEDA